MSRIVRHFHQRKALPDAFLDVVKQRAAADAGAGAEDAGGDAQSVSRSAKKLRRSLAAE